MPLPIGAESLVEPGGVFVKICGITSAADALLAVGMGASAVGFVFAPSPRQMSAVAVADIVKRLPPEILTVGVFRDETPERVVDIVRRTGLGGVQLHGMETPSQTQHVAASVRWVIKAFSAGHQAIARFDSYGASFLMIDGAQPGSGELFDWRLAEGVVDPDRLIVAGGLRPENVGVAIAHLRPFGVDVSSGVESAPGRKDPVALAAFMAAVRRAAEEAGYQDRVEEEDDARFSFGRFPVGPGNEVPTPPPAHDPVAGRDTRPSDQLGLFTNLDHGGGRAAGADSSLFDWQSE